MSTAHCLPKALSLPGSRHGAQQLRMCDQHKETTTPEGGVQMNPNKWVCASCWVRFVNRK